MSELSELHFKSQQKQTALDICFTGPTKSHWPIYTTIPSKTFNHHRLFSKPSLFRVLKHFTLPSNPLTRSQEKFYRQKGIVDLFQSNVGDDFTLRYQDTNSSLL